MKQPGDKLASAMEYMPGKGVYEENGELFAPIKPKEISRYFQENFKEDINPSQIDLKQEIKKIGKFSLSINLHSDVLAELQVLVEKKEAK